MQRTDRGTKSRGQAVVEFALILPVFLLLTLGVVDMARLFAAYISLTNGVSNAALYAGAGGYGKWCSAGSTITCPGGGPAPAANPDNIAYQIQVETTGLNQSLIAFSAPQCTATIGGAVGNCANLPTGTYSRVKIVASYDVGLLTPLQFLFGGPIHLTAATTAATY
jgi:hypothetical protein